MSHIIRGDDLLDSAARQLALFRALDFTPEPIFMHLPLVIGPDGRRLAKRHGDTRISMYRDLGVPATRIIALAPERYEGYALRGIQFSDQKRYQDAERQFRMATDRAPDHALPHLLLAQALEQQGAHEDALLLYGKVVSMYPNNREAFMLFGRLSQRSINQLSAVNE